MAKTQEWIRTFSGGQFHVCDPRPEEILVEDLAHALSNVCRFVGHVKAFYSVSEHSVRVSYVLPVELQLWGLLHDASEAFISDLPSPLHYAEGIGGYRTYEARIMKCVAKRFDLEWPMPHQVKEVDRRLARTEQRDLMGMAPEELDSDYAPLPDVIVPWTSAEAERRFLMRFQELGGVK